MAKYKFRGCDWMDLPYALGIKPPNGLKTNPKIVAGTGMWPDEQYAYEQLQTMAEDAMAIHMSHKLAPTKEELKQARKFTKTMRKFLRGFADNYPDDPVGMAADAFSKMPDWAMIRWTMSNLTALWT